LGFRDEKIEKENELKEMVEKLREENESIRKDKDMNV